MDYLRVSLVVGPQLFAGCLIYLLLLKRDDVSAVELLSIGSVLGIVLSTMVDQIFVNLQLPKIGWLVAVFAVISVFLIVKRNQKITIATVNWGSEPGKSFFPIVAISAMALGSEWFWLFPSGVLLVVASFFSIVGAPKFGKILVRLFNLGAVAVGAFMIANRPKIWWVIDEADYPFLQAFSRSIADRGLNDVMNFSGNPVKYYWLSYAWIGLVDRTSDASTLFVFTRVAPLLFAIIITGTVWILINYYSLSRFRTFATTLVVMTASSFPPWEWWMKITSLISPSSFFAFAPLFALIFLLLCHTPQSLRYRVAAIAFLSSATMLTKVFNGFILVAAMTFALGVQLIFKPEVAKTMVLTYLVSLISLLGTYFLFISSSESSEGFEIGPFDFIWQIQGSTRFLPEIYADLIGGFTIISYVALPALLIVASLLRTKLFESKAIDLLSIGSLLAGAFLASVLLFMNGENLYFIRAAVGFSSLLGFASLSSKNSFGQSKRSTTFVLIIFGIILCFLSFLIPNADSGSGFWVIVRSAWSHISAFLIICLALCVLLVNFIRRRSSFSQIYKMIIVASTMAVCFSVVNWFNTTPEKHDEWSRNGESYLGTDEMLDLADWTNKNTNTDDIFASNFGWPRLNADQEGIFAAPCYFQRIKYGGDCLRTRDGLLMMHIHRLFWLQATGSRSYVLDPEMKDRQSATLGFVADPTSTQVKQMLNDGVDWFLVDRTTTDRTSWEPFASIKYTNDSFFALQLNENN